MAESLVIVESPAKAKTIGKFLGSKYKVIASVGHIRDLPKSQMGIDIEHGFEPKYITLRGKGDVVEAIRKAAKSADRVYLATDPDREGEAISWHLAKLLKLDPNSQCRIVFNEITAKAVKGSISKARKIDENLFEAQQARRILDRLVGYKLGPILWAKVRKGLSAGRVQSVATRIICDREDEITAFLPEEYWTISAMLEAGGKKKPFEAKFFGIDGKKLELGCKEEADAILDRVRGAEFTSNDIKVSEKRKHAAPPFTTSSLQQEASRKLNFTTKRTMMVAQQLYEGVEIGGGGAAGLVSYIRTDSVRVSSEAQEAARTYIGSNYGDNYVPKTPNFYKGRKNAQDAHEAIRPTNIINDPKKIKQYLTADQYKLYKLIYERFIASQMSEAVLEQCQVNFDANGCSFRSTGVRTLFDGFTAVYTEGKDVADDDEVRLPPIEQGQTFKAQSVDAQQRFTQPPPRYTEASLVKYLEEKGIGRPSTYAPTISTIVDRGYIVREKKTLMPTELGFVVTKLMKDNFSDIVDIRFTSEMENSLDRIEENEADWRTVVSEFYEPFSKELAAAEASIEHVKLEDEVSDIPCDKCGAMMVYKYGRFGKFLACPNYPQCRNTKPVLERIGVKCPKCGADIAKKKSSKKKVFYGCERFPDCDFVSWDKPTRMQCPKCGGIMAQHIGRNGSYLVCMDKNCGYIHRKTKSKDADVQD